ncbi:hypothetical protein CAL15_22185 [Bordetella genomosp. 13]|uniref:Nitroreductase domain-containing protein n=1 Tax=Bordetella genomosp. 13 TaxID=463040 RepID=A0A1W6ZHE5_9BORD|nr:hypothetical protein CAL15_22185 [Bordetella genomosp. 13]
MSAVLDLLASHRSVRSFADRPVEPALLERVYAAALRSPSWNNAQNVTLIEVRDEARKSELATLCGNQQSIHQAPVFGVLVMDFHKTAVAAARHGRRQTAHEDVNGLLIGAVDAGIVLGALMVAARAEGLAVCPIGGIRRETAAVIELLGLPPLTLPLAGLCLGYTESAPGPVKPRLPLAAFCHPESYDAARIENAVQAIDRAMADYRQAQGTTAGSWSDAVSARYASMPAYAGVAGALHAQGFRFGAQG